MNVNEPYKQGGWVKDSKEKKKAPSMWFHLWSSKTSTS